MQYEYYVFSYKMNRNSESLSHISANSVAWNLDKIEFPGVKDAVSQQNVIYFTIMKHVLVTMLNGISNVHESCSKDKDVFLNHCTSCTTLFNVTINPFIITKQTIFFLFSIFSQSKFFKMHQIREYRLHTI